MLFSIDHCGTREAFLDYYCGTRRMLLSNCGTQTFETPIVNKPLEIVQPDSILNSYYSDLS